MNWSGANSAALWSWWWQAMSSPVGLGCAGGLVVLTVVGVFAGRAAVRLGAAGAMREAAAGERGTATIEFSLILPVLLTIGLLLVQTTLVMAGNLFVHYSAFAAARSAVVQIPAAYDGEPANTYRDVRGGRKRATIHRSAAMALLPVAGPEGSAGDEAWLGEAVAEGLGAMHGRLGEAEPYWVADRMAGRMRYALEQTQVQVLRMHGGTAANRRAEVLTDDAVEARDALAVHVEHRLHLPVPYVNRVFADGRTDWDGWTMQLGARSMLTNFGLSDRLPEQPELRRVP